MRAPTDEEMSAICYVNANPEPDPWAISSSVWPEDTHLVIRMLSLGFLVLAVPHDIRIALEEGEPFPWQT